MAGKSEIEWTQFTWNPIAGCSVKSPGCKHCYAMPLAARLEAMGQELYKGLTTPSNAGPVFNGTVRQAGDHVLLAPLKRKKPTTYFVNSMSDLFHENVPDEWIDRIFAVMALCPQHTFQVLTKRAERMRGYLSMARAHPVGLEALGISIECYANNSKSMVGEGITLKGDIAHLSKWPLPNVWLGVSTERQQEADERIPHLLQTPAAVRFISAEPLLGPIDLTNIDIDGDSCANALAPCTWKETWHRNWRGTTGKEADEMESFLDWHNLSAMPSGLMHPKLDWVIVGGESGPGARPMHPEWASSLRRQCQEAGVAFFFKQWGKFAPCDAINVSKLHALCGAMCEPPYVEKNWRRALEFFQKSKGVAGTAVLARIGKKAAGRLLDGIEHNAMPGPRP
jgi:protein gp37